MDNYAENLTDIQSHMLSTMCTAKPMWLFHLLSLWQVINRTLDTYDASEIFLSFNGGKDCTVLLDLMSKLFVEKFPTKRLLCLYIQPENPFDEIEEFIKDCERQYKIEVKAIRGTVKGALDEICKQNSSRLKVCVMGCRRTDPHCENLNEYQVRTHRVQHTHINAEPISQ